MLAVVNFAQDRVMDALLASKPDLEHLDKVVSYVSTYLNFLVNIFPVW